MNENPNVSHKETPEEIFQAVSSLITDLLNSTHQIVSEPSTSDSAPTSRRHETVSHIIQVQPRQYPPKPTYEIYKASSDFTESQSDVNVEQYLATLNRPTDVPKPSLPCVPPSYSTVIKQGRPSLDIRRDVRSMEVQHISPFSRIPPPSYNQIHGVWSREISNTSSEEVLLGPEPTYIWCSHCATVVITVTQAQRSKFTHITAAALCLFGCWPCALLPYCLNSCKNIYHYCPECNYLFGMYRPW